MQTPAASASNQLDTLRTHLTALQQRHDLAQRRLVAYTKQHCNPEGLDNVYVGTPSAIAAMRERLRACAHDEAQVEKLALELRQVKEQLTEQALQFYAKRCDDEGFGLHQ